MRNLVGGLCAAAMVSACGTMPKANNRALSADIVEDAVRSNEVYTQATNAIILKNILRARDRWPRAYTTLSGISTEPSDSLVVSPGLSTRGGAGNLLPFTFNPGNLTRGSASRKSYTVNPIADLSRSELLLTRISSPVFERYFNDWPKDVVLLLFVQEWEAVDIATGNTLATHSSAGDEYDELMSFLGRYAGADVATKGFEFTDTAVRAVASATSKPCAEDMLSLSDLMSDGAAVDNLVKLKELSGAKVSLAETSSADTVTVRLCPPEAAAVKVLRVPGSSDVEFRVKFRSFENMVYYIGETLRERGSSARVRACGMDGRPLFRLAARGEQGPFAVTVKHAGERYAAMPVDQCPDHRTDTVMSLLNELLLLNQSDEFIKAPQIFNR